MDFIVGVCCNSDPSARLHGHSAGRRDLPRALTRHQPLHLTPRRPAISASLSSMAEIVCRGPRGRCDEMF